MYGIMIADHYLAKKQTIALHDLYTMAPAGSLYFDGGWNRKAHAALASPGRYQSG